MFQLEIYITSVFHNPSRPKQWPKTRAAESLGIPSRPKDEDQSVLSVLIDLTSDSSSFLKVRLNCVIGGIKLNDQELIFIDKNRVSIFYVSLLFLASEKCILSHSILSYPLMPLLFFNPRSSAVAAVAQYYKATCWVFHLVLGDMAGGREKEKESENKHFQC